MKKKFSKMLNVVFLAIILFSASAFYAKAYDAPNIYVKEINIKQLFLNEGESIEGDFLIWNSENEVASGASYGISLDQGRDVFNKRMFFVSEALGPNKELKQNFSYPIPSFFPAGEYELKIQIFSQSGLSLGWKKIPVNIKGTGIYLSIKDSSFVQGGRNLNPQTGASFDANVIPKIKFKVFNPSTKKIDFKAQVVIYSAFESPQEMKRFLGDKYSINPKEAKEIELDLPKYERPGVYLAKIVLMDQDIPISKAENFTWNIKGESVKIINVAVGTDSLQAGKEVQVSVDFMSVTDGKKPGEIKLSIDLYDSKSKKNIASGEKAISFGPAITTEVLNLISNASSEKFTGEVRITKDGDELAFYSIGSPDSVPAVKPVEKRADNSDKYLIAALIVIIIIVILLLFMKYYRKGMKVILLFFLVGAGFFGVEMAKVQAGSWTAGWTYFLTKNAPMQDSVVDYGSAINYQGSVDAVNEWGYGGQLRYAADVDITTSVCGIDTFNCVMLKEEKRDHVIPNGAAYNTTDNMLYVLDGDLAKQGWMTAASRIMKVDPTGVLPSTFLNLGAIELNLPQDIFYSAPYLYVADTYNNRIIRFNPANIAGTMQVFNNSGIGGIDFTLPQGIFYSAPYLFVEDYDPNTADFDKRIFRMNISTGAWDVYALPGLSSSFGDVAFDPATSYVYVTDPGNNRIVKFDINNMAATLGEINSDVSGEVLTEPKGIFYSSPYLYVADQGAGRIVRLNPDDSSDAWTILGSSGAGVGKFNSPSGIFYYSSNIYVADGGNDRMVKFNPGNINATWTAFDFSVDTYDINANIPAYFNPGFKLADGTTDRDLDNNIAPSRSFYAKLEIKYTLEDGSFKNLTSFTRIKLINSAAITPVVCKLYGVTDTNGNDTGIITIDQNTGKVIVLSEFDDGDIENLDIHPTTNYIYVATDQSDDYPHGSIFIVNGLTGALTPPGGTPTGIDGIIALSFRPTDNTLWVWSKEGGQGNKQGLSKIIVSDENITSITNVYPSSIQVEGLAWSNDGTVLYASAGDKLYEYDPGTNTLTEVADNLPGPVEGLDMRSDGYLYVGKHNTDDLYIYDPVTRTNKGSLALTMDASSAVQIPSNKFDVEGLAWPGGCSFNLPTATGLDVDPNADFCTMPGYTFKWTFSDSDAGDFQGRYRILIDAHDNFLTPTIDFEDSPTVSGNNFQMNIGMGYGDDASLEGSNPLYGIAYGTTYYWKIMVWDNNGTASNWITPAPATFTTEENAWPIVGFTPESSSFPPAVAIPFYAGGGSDWNSTYCFNSGWVPEVCNAWNWDFCKGEACSNKAGVGESVNHAYPISEIGAHEVALTARDSNGHTCSNSSTFIIDSNAASAPTVVPDPQQLIDYCTDNLPAAVSLSWVFSDADDGANQTAYEIVVDKYDSSWNFVANCSPGKRGSALSPDNTSMLSGTDVNNSCPGFISYGNFIYRWKIRVFDSDDNENTGGFINGENFPKNGPTPTHAYPIPKFTYSPNSNLMQFMNITFDPSISIIDPGVFVTRMEWKWGEPGVTDVIVDDPPGFPGLDLSNQEIVHSYVIIGPKTVDLGIRDSDGHECWASDRGNDEDLFINSNKPKWDETVPE